MRCAAASLELEVNYEAGCYCSIASISDIESLIEEIMRQTLMKVSSSTVCLFFFMYVKITYFRSFYLSDYFYNIDMLMVQNLAPIANIL